MKNRKVPIFLIILIIIAVLAIIFSLWKIYKPSTTVNNNIEPNSTSTTATTTGTFEEKTFSDKNDFYEISAKYPSDPLDKNNDVETFVLSKIKEKQNEWKVGGDVYDGEKETEEKFPDRPKMVYTYDISYEKYESQDKGTVSYVLKIYEFTGGAHGITVVQTFTFDNNGLVDIQDVLNLAANNNAINLSRVLATSLEKNDSDVITEDMMMEGLGLAYLKADGKTFDKVKCACDGFNFASNFQNFYITNAGITFLFSQYQVAPGAAGIVATTLDWNTLKPYLIKYQ